MLNGIFVVIVLFSILMAAFTGRMEMLSKAVLESARSAVTLALGLIGVMAFFLGLMRVASDGGLLRIMARGRTSRDALPLPRHSQGSSRHERHDPEHHLQSPGAGETPRLPSDSRP